MPMRVLDRVLCLVAVTVLLPACATLTTGGQNVRVYDSDVVIGCRHLGDLTYGYVGSEEGLLMLYRNEAARLGGDVLALSELRSERGNSMGRAAAYDCSQATATALPGVVAFSVSEYQPYSTKGASGITGQAFFKTRGGEVRFGAGDQVFLDPATRYQTAKYFREVLGIRIADPQGRHVLVPGADGGLMRYRRSTTADAEGRFKFDGLASGRYFLSCKIEWEAAGERTGGWATKVVEVPAATNVEAILADSIPPFDELLGSDIH